MATWTGSEQDERHITAQDLINDQVKSLYCRQASHALVLPQLQYNYDRNGFFLHYAIINGQLKMSFIRLYEHVLISLPLLMFVKKFMWKTYVRQYERTILLAAYDQRRV